MTKFYNKFLIVSSLALLFLGVYVYFSHNLDVEAESSLTSSSQTPLATNSSFSQDTAFLATLTSLTQIKIDTSLFSNKAFNALTDNSVILEQVAIGRLNPFSIPRKNDPLPLPTPVVLVTTSDATGVTPNSAMLNGATSATTGITNTYFEYGLTNKFGKVTSASIKPTRGAFVGTVTGLKSKTQYFFRAAAKINGTVGYGTTVSFTTN